MKRKSSISNTFAQYVTSSVTMQSSQIVAIKLTVKSVHQGSKANNQFVLTAEANNLIMKSQVTDKPSIASNCLAKCAVSSLFFIKLQII